MSNPAAGDSQGVTIPKPPSRWYLVWANDEPFYTEERLTAVTVAYHWGKAGRHVTMTSFTA